MIEGDSMEGIVGYIISGILFFSILYFIVRGAVEDGIINALLKYEDIKKSNNEKADNKS